MTENQKLAEGQNPKTLLPLRYVPPIASEYWRSEDYVVSGINSASGNPPVDVDPSCVSSIVVSSSDLQSFGNIFYKPGYEGATHLSNNGLLMGGSGSELNNCRNPVTSKEERRGTLSDDRGYFLTPNTPNGPQSIYDPRHYGFADRLGRVNEDLGRVEYDYRDIDRFRIPHFLSRNQLDSTLINNELYGDVNVNAFAVKNHTDSVLDQREEMQAAWLSRHESDRLQRKLYPVNTNGQFMSKG